jgi:hypothetical protein
MSEKTSQPAVGTYRDLYFDALLEFLDLEDQKQASISVSLLVGGTLVCGDLIGHDQWAAAFERWMAEAGEGADLVARFLKSVGEKIDPRADEDPLYFAHLKNARVVTNYRGGLDGDVVQGMESPLWRVRVQDVQGWTMGRPS